MAETIMAEYVTHNKYNWVDGKHDDVRYQVPGTVRGVPGTGTNKTSTEYVPGRVLLSPLLITVLST